ncbi:hypothetical protein FGL83_07775 [Leuconostoc lactis]|uniref:HNH endonuclease n=1 Tax=Leuconostoc lactis TaxID=1246 RepID=A0AAP9EEJ5_LEULA|nr:hypothetical protein [Leuconostoc lactis]QEA44581.1 hypothetical protein FGL83_07775 [Leuconostoc lactis]
MGKTHSGECCVCGKKGKLTFEHIPPRNANNRNQVKTIINPIDLFENDTDFGEKIKGIDFRLSSQKGMGDYTLCDRCNNFFGSNYVNEFIPFYNELADFFKSNYQEIIDKSNNGYLDIVIQANINFFRFQKQVVAMLMSTSKGVYKQYFKEYLLDDTNTNFPNDKFKIIMNGYLDYKLSRQNGQLIGFNFSGNSEIIGSEIQVFPLGFTLVKLNGSDKENNIETGLDITNWSNLDDSRQTMRLSLRTYINSQLFPYYLTGVTP